jgi:glycosyltransferase involved in cell wall biosynthesis
MLSSEERRPGEGPGAICFVANDFNYLVRNGGIGTYFWNTSHVLAAHGWRVHVLYASSYVEDQTAVPLVKRRLAQAGITFSLLDDHAPPAHAGLYLFEGWTNLARSERVRAALEQLHAAHRFNLIEFAEWGGVGFRSIQAKRAGLAFADVRLMVKMHSSSQWCREGNHQWMNSIEDLRNDYLERYSFENCDIQLAPCRYMFDYARSNQWRVRADSPVVGYGFPDAPRAVLVDPSPQPLREIVFFGRLEARKGLEIFLDACDHLPAELTFSFLGKDTTLNNGRTAGSWIPERLAGRQVVVQLMLNQEQALNYLRQPGRLAIMPSLADNFPYTVIECATQGIPFVASAVGGVPEMISDETAQQHLLFQPNARDLARCLNSYLAADPEQRSEWHDRVRKCTDVDRNNRRLDQHYRSLGPAPAQPAAARASHEPPLVTVGVTHYNLGDYLPATLASLAAQTYSHVEVIVIDDGSTCEKSRAVFAEQEKIYPKYRFIRQENGGCGAARNAVLELARGELFVPLDADNLFTPHMLAAFVQGMRCRPDAAALTCYCLAFRDGKNPDGGEYLYCYTPAGGPHVMAGFENVYGDTNAALRTAALRQVGGYETDRASMAWQDWMTYVKLVSAGMIVDVIPEALFYYRVREDSMLSQANGWAREYAFQQRLIRKYFTAERLAPPEQASLMASLISYRYVLNHLYHEIDALRNQTRALSDRLGAARYRAVDGLNRAVRTIPLLHTGLKSVLKFGWRTIKSLGGRRAA